MELNKKTWRNVFLVAAGGIILYWLLHETNRISAAWGTVVSLFSPFIAGAAIAFILNVPMRAIERLLRKIEKTGLRRGIAILLTLVAVLLVLTGVVYLVIPQVVSTAETLLSEIPEFIIRVAQWGSEWLQDNPELLEWLSENTNFNSIEWTSLLQQAFTELSNRLSSIMNSLSSMVDQAFSAVVAFGNGVFDAVLSVVFALYCLSRKEILARQGRRIIYAVLPEAFCDETVRILRMANTTFSNFISGQCLEAVILGIMFVISMSIFGMPYMPLVSVIIMITALVPIVGAFVGCALGAFFILVDDPTMAFWFVIMFLVLQQIEGNVIYPKVVGTSIGLPGMWVLVALAVGGDLMGVGGMLLMIPLASVLYALVREYTTKRLVAKGIDPDKLRDHPPELKSGFKAKREKRNGNGLITKLKNRIKKGTEK